MVYMRNTSQCLWRVRAGVLVVLILSGCAPPELPLPEPLPLAITVCPGKIDKGESLKAIKTHSENIMPLKASGECKLQYHTEDGQKHYEQFPIKVRIVPPNQIYVQGGPVFVPKAIVLGANEREFWGWLKPEEMSAYWWGRLSETEDCLNALALNPCNVLEALGVIAVEDAEGWTLWNKDAFDILERQAPNGSRTKRVFINCCDYLIRRIQYFDGSGQIVLITMLDKYKPIISGFSMPRDIKIIRFGEGDKHDFIDIRLNSIRPADFSREQLNFMFSRPEPKGFKHIYRRSQSCELIRQQQPQ
jgi:hypothetical protein